jgi:hypothetical protein
MIIVKGIRPPTGKGYKKNMGDFTANATVSDTIFSIDFQPKT